MNLDPVDTHVTAAPRCQGFSMRYALGVASTILIIGFVAVLIKTRSLLQISAEINLNNYLPVACSLLDLTHNQTLAKVSSQGKWTGKLRLGSKDDGTSYAELRLIKLDGAFVNFPSIILVNTPDIRINTNGIHLMQKNSDDVQFLAWQPLSATASDALPVPE